MSFAAPTVAPRRRTHARRTGARVRRLALASLAFGASLAIAAGAQAQQPTNGQIYIPGPGERAGQTANAASSPITIAGPGERQSAGEAGAVDGVITIPGPGERPATAGNAARAGQTARAVNPAAGAGAASSAVVPVVVTPAPRVARPVQPIAVDRPASAAADARKTTAPAANAVSAPAGAVPALPKTAAPAGNMANAPTNAANSTNATNATSAAAGAEPAAAAGKQDGESIRAAALAYLQQQAAGLPGKITITVAPAFPRGLAACTTLVPFMPPGARPWGRTTVGVRCAGDRPWTLYLQARVSLVATYYLAAHQIEPGAVLSAADLSTREGDLANLPRTIVTDASQAVGAVALARITAGVPLRQDMLRSASSVTIGQSVRVVAVGQGFTISSEGSVMNNAAPGQQVRVKTAGGQIISGVVKDSATVEIQM